MQLFYVHTGAAQHVSSRENLPHPNSAVMEKVTSNIRPLFIFFISMCFSRFLELSWLIRNQTCRGLQCNKCCITFKSSPMQQGNSLVYTWPIVFSKMTLCSEIIQEYMRKYFCSFSFAAVFYVHIENVHSNGVSGDTPTVI